MHHGAAMPSSKDQCGHAVVDGKSRAGPQFAMQLEMRANIRSLEAKGKGPITRNTDSLSHADNQEVAERLGNAYWPTCS